MLSAERVSERSQTGLISLSIDRLKNLRLVPSRVGLSRFLWKFLVDLPGYDCLSTFVFVAYFLSVQQSIIIRHNRYSFDIAAVIRLTRLKFCLPSRRRFLSRRIA